MLVLSALLQTGEIWNLKYTAALLKWGRISHAHNIFWIYYERFLGAALLSIFFLFCWGILANIIWGGEKCSFRFLN